MQLINFYNTVHPEDPNSILTILREDILPTTLLDSSLLLGDFNTHYPYEPTPHKSVNYRAFKRGFQASRNQSQSLYMALTK